MGQLSETARRHGSSLRAGQPVAQGRYCDVSLSRSKKIKLDPPLQSSTHPSQAGCALHLFA